MNPNTNRDKAFYGNIEIQNLDDFLGRVACQLPKPIPDILNAAKNQYQLLKENQQSKQAVHGLKTQIVVKPGLYAEFKELDTVIHKAENYDIKGHRGIRKDFELLLVGYQMSQPRKSQQNLAATMPPLQSSKFEPKFESVPNQDVLKQLAKTTITSKSVVVEKTHDTTSERPISPTNRGTFVSIPKEEYDMLVKSEQINRAKIDELASRLSMFASKQLSDQNPNIVDLSDRNRPTKIGEKFSELYDNEWTDAFEELKTQNMSDEDIISMLSNIVQLIQWNCEEIASQQLKRLEGYMEFPMKEVKWSPKSLDKVYTCKGHVDHKAFSYTHKHAKDYRKATAAASVSAVSEMFKCLVFDVRYKIDLHKLKNLNLYIDGCVECVWLMCVQDPRMNLTWVEPGDKIDTEIFKFYRKKGTVAKHCVWPAVFLNKGGALVSKGYVYPQ